MRKTLFASAAILGIALATPAVAETTTPDDYLAQALGYVQQHHERRAAAAVDNAETVLLEPPAPYGSRATRNEPSEVVRDVGRAREAIQQRRWGDAEYYIDAAMSHPSANLPGTPFYATAGGAARHQM